MSSLKSDFKQLGNLLWKNIVLQKRSKLGLFLELVLPAIFAAILLPIRGIVKSQINTDDKVYNSFSLDAIPPIFPPKNYLDRNITQFYIGYSPNNSSFTYQIIKNAIDKINKKIPFEPLQIALIGFKDEDEMSKTDNLLYLNKLTNRTMYRLGGVAFLESNSDILDYKIRLSYSQLSPAKTRENNKWKTNLIYPVNPILGPRDQNDTYGGAPGYYREGFLILQNNIETSFISMVANLSQNIDLSNKISLKRFPYPPYNDDNFIIVIQAIFPFILMISFFFPVILTAKSIVSEKETGLKEAMKIMGMKPWVYWLSWYIKTFLIILPAVLFILIAFKIELNISGGGKAAILNRSDWSVLLVFFLLYMSSSITFTFVITTLFKKANSAAAGAGVIWFLSYLPYVFINIRYEAMTSTEKLLATFINNLGMAESIQLIGFFETKGVGINWSNINEPVSVSDNFTMLQCLIVSFFTNFIHLAIFYYIEQINPGDNGIAKKWYFPLQALCPGLKIFKKSSVDSEKIGLEKKVDPDTVFIESDSIHASKNVGIKIDNVTKEFKQFGKLKTAVKNLSFNIFENHITVLLGHNGAGKSTTISMITGLTSPTSGQILVDNCDIVTETTNARKKIGFCPQYNLLFDNMTVKEHLIFFSKLKERYDPEEIKSILESLSLSDKTNALSKTLSGGMKRKLSVAIAFIGGSEIVILDEPTSGMDPQARHATWTVLQNFKRERKCSILLTTHFMDEADFLGDRIAIMSRGSLRCCGSPLYLKSKYGSGYNLVINRNLDMNRENDESTKKLINVIKGHVSNAELNTNINSEISFILPKEETSKFPNLFNDLEANKKELNIINVGVSITTVEEVFLKIGELEDCEESTNQGVSDESLNNSEKTNKSTLEKAKSIDDYGLFIGSNPSDRNELFFPKYKQQFRALIVKKLIHSLRNKSLVVSQLVVPIFTLLLILILVKYGPIQLGDSDPLEINLSKYRDNYIPFNVLNNQSDFANSLSIMFKNEFQNESAFNVNTPKKQSCSSENVESYISCIGRSDLSEYTDNYIIGATFNSDSNQIDNSISVVGHFNNQPFHTPPLALNLITNSIFKTVMNSSYKKIKLVNHPLPRTLDEELEDIQKLGVVGGFQIASTITFGFAFLISSFASFLIKERVSNAKHMQYLNGANPVIFWIANICWDIINYFIPSVFCIILILAFGIDEYTGFKIKYIIGLFIVYGFAHIPQTYFISYLFDKPATGFAVNVAWNIFSSQVTIIAVYILQQPALDLVDIGDALEWVFMIILPNFAFGQSLTDVYVNSEYNDLCLNNNLSSATVCKEKPNFCCIKYKNCGASDCFKWNEDYMAWDKPGLGRYFLFMPLQFIVQFSVILFYELGLLRKFFYILKSVFTNGNKDETPQINASEQLKEEELFGDISKDEDVRNEEQRISYDKTDLLVIENLTKYYSNFMAVKGISLGIKHGECFGLLGVNGAGKTTSFKMITGDELITKGDVILNKISIKKDVNKYQKQIGYCPQFDPLIERMTCIETLVMYARLRGLKENLILKTCLSLINLLDLSDHGYKMVQTLSGGNKRKLSVAISLIGSPIVVLLDEPTSGMDPGTRRFLWNCLNNIREKGKSLILTTHSMEETEALCTRMGIMVNGELKCLGNLQHLKSIYGDGYTLLAKLTPERGELLEVSRKFIEKILQNFANCVLKENRDGFINIQVKDNSIKTLGKIFSLVEEIKNEFFVEYYFVTQTKLEQIFLNFASRQIDPASRILEKKSKFFC